MRFRILYRQPDGSWHSGGSILFPEPIQQKIRTSAEFQVMKAHLANALEAVGLYAPKGKDLLTWNVAGLGTVTFTVHDAQDHDGEPILMGAGQTVSESRGRKIVLGRKYLQR